MRVNIYCIYDKVAESAGPLFQAVNDGVAIRQAVRTLSQVPKSLREEYDLRRIGEYDDKLLVGHLYQAVSIDYQSTLDKQENYAVVEVE
ncbi:MAG: nonstructural protein [Arizlama microvirus]|nr:MAG: nonstructural protein [Arizlama microvirus]